MSGREMSCSRMVALANVLWNPKEHKDLEDFMDRLSGWWALAVSRRAPSTLSAILTIIQSNEQL